MTLTPHLRGSRAASFAACLALGTLAVAGGPGCRADVSAVAPAADALPVETALIESVDHYSVSSRHVGRVMARRQSDLGFTRSDRLVEIWVDEGDRVEAGQPLARLDTARLRAQRTDWLAQRREVKARLDLARLTLDRREELAGKDSISAQRYDEARFEAIALEARLASIAAGIERVDIDLTESTLVAPFAGAIIRRLADEGAILSPGAPVVTLIENEVMEVRVGVPPALAARLRVGDRHSVEIGDVTLEAAIATIRDDINADTRTVTVVLPIEAAPPGIFRHGALARLIISERRDTPGYWLPITALTESRRGLWSAYALAPSQEPETFVATRHELMMIHVDSDRAFVRGTLIDGDEIIVTGLQRIAPGQRVQRAARMSAVR